MGKQSNNIAILFFSRSAQAEAKNKRYLWDRNIKQNTQIASSLITHTVSQINKTDLPCYHIDEQQQVGQNFGERFANAFERIFEKGFDYVISVGNDIPKLKAQHIVRAATQLQSGSAEIVLGPDTDGGTWLMGYSRDAFAKRRFQRLPWNTDQLLDTILEKEDSSSIHLLEKLSDIDCPKELKAFFRQSSLEVHLQTLISQLRSIVAGTVQHFVSTTILLISLRANPFNRLRAPPTR